MPLIKVPETIIKVMSLNMQYAAGPECRPNKDFLRKVPWEAQRHNLIQIVNLINEIDPDLVVLQEVDKYSGRTDFVDQADIIARGVAKKRGEEKTYNVEFGSCIDLDQKKMGKIWEIARNLYQRDRAKWVFKNLGIETDAVPDGPIRLHFGNATLSKLPVKEREHTFFRPPYWEPWMNLNLIRRKDERKSKLVCRVNYYEEVPEKIPLYVYNTHLADASPENRKKQSKIICKAIEQRKNAHIVLGGDLNAELRDDSIKALIEGSMMKGYEGLYLDGEDVHCPEYSTFPSENPHELLDTILISEYLEYVSYEVHPARVSDHLAVVAEVRIKQDLVPESRLKRIIDDYSTNTP